MNHYIKNLLLAILCPLSLIFVIYHSMERTTSPFVVATETVALVLLTHVLYHIVAQPWKKLELMKKDSEATSKTLGEVLRNLSRLQEQVFGLCLELCPHTPEDVCTNHGQVNHAAELDSLQDGQVYTIQDTYIPHFNRCIPSLIDALNRGAEIRFLTLNPDSPAVPARSRRIQNIIPFEDFRQGILEYTDTIANVLLTVPQAKLEVRYYNDDPGFPLYLLEAADGTPIKALQGFFLNSATVHDDHYAWRHTRPDCQLDRFQKYLNMRWEENKINRVPLMALNKNVS